jgi:hypothetical protein
LGRRWLAAFFLILAALLPARAAQNIPLEPAVKATFLHKFIPFVTWPAGTFENPTSPVVICTLGSDAVGDLLDEAIAGQRFEQHPLALRHLQSITRDAPCNVLYIAVDDAAAAAQAISVVRGRPVLTVTDSSRVGGAASIISFVVADNRVRFDVDQNAAAENNLVLSSKLLSLARNVRSAARRP